MDELIERVRRLDPAKRKLLVERMRAQGAEVPLAFYPYLRPEFPRLAENQARLFILRELDASGATGYHVPTAVRLKGRVDVAVLERALNRLVERHEPLRTVFKRTPQGDPYQAVLPEHVVRLQTASVTDSPDPQVALTKWLKAQAETPFQLDRLPLFRALLIDEGASSHVLSMVFHHIVTDGWSTNILVRDLIAFYEAELGGTEVSLPPLAIQPLDHAHWLSERTQGFKDFWRQQLAGMQPSYVPELGKSSAADAKGTYRFGLTAEETQAVRATARRLNTTPYTVMYAALSLTVSRYTGMRDVVLGTTVAGRERVELENLVGYFSTALPLRLQHDWSATTDTYVGAARDVVLRAFEHQAHTPFEELAGDLRLAREAGRNAFFETMFVYQNYTPAKLQMADIEVTALELENEGSGRAASFDLQWVVVDAEPFEGLLYYRRSRFAASAIVDLVAAFRRVLTQVAENTIIGELKLHDAPVERAYGPPLPQPADTVVSRFRDTAQRVPEAPALFVGDDVWSYADLKRRVDGIAHALVARGVTRGDRVGVCADRSADLIATLLGVMSVGAAYVPLEPELPEKRLAFIVADSGMRAVVVDGHGASATSWPASVDVVALEAVVGHAGAQRTVDPDDLAYIIYTSGTTGNPKGVAVAHASVANHLASKIASCGYRGDERFLARSSFAFDMSVTEMFCPLTTGGSLVVAKPGGHRDARYISELIRRHGVQVMEVVPSGLAMLLEAGGFEACRSLEKVVLGGEALSTDLRDRFLDALPNATLFNPYGPTEATVEATTIACRRGAPITIGRAMHNQSAHVVDAMLQEVPAWVPGELFLGGAGLAWGYHGNPRRTATSFVPAPTGRAGSRWYRSGDITRWNSDDEIEYIGRRDHQIQVRGVRVEIEEIETAIRSIPGVGDVVVVPVNESEGRADSLIAYVVRSASSREQETKNA